MDGYIAKEIKLVDEELDGWRISKPTKNIVCWMIK